MRAGEATSVIGSSSTRNTSGMFLIAYAIMSRKARWPLVLGVLAIVVGVFGFVLE
jgi:uncharacterized membrane protein HdeD (DUF308 family)